MLASVVPFGRYERRLTSPTKVESSKLIVTSWFRFPTAVPKLKVSNQTSNLKPSSTILAFFFNFERTGKDRRLTSLPLRALDDLSVLLQVDRPRSLLPLLVLHVEQEDSVGLLDGGLLLVGGHLVERVGEGLFRRSEEEQREGGEGGTTSAGRSWRELREGEEVRTERMAEASKPSSYEIKTNQREERERLISYREREGRKGLKLGSTLAPSL